MFVISQPSKKFCTEVIVSSTHGNDLILS